jgi:hypothetical protein
MSLFNPVQTLSHPIILDERKITVGKLGVSKVKNKVKVKLSL